MSEGAGWRLAEVPNDSPDAHPIVPGPDGLEFIAVGGPRPEEGDGQMAEDPWPEES